MLQTTQNQTAINLLSYESEEATSDKLSAVEMRDSAERKECLSPTSKPEPWFLPTASNKARSASRSPGLQIRPKAIAARDTTRLDSSSRDEIKRSLASTIPIVTRNTGGICTISTCSLCKAERIDRMLPRNLPGKVDPMPKRHAVKKGRTLSLARSVQLAWAEIQYPFQRERIGLPVELVGRRCQASSRVPQWSDGKNPFRTFGPSRLRLSWLCRQRVAKPEWCRSGWRTNLPHNRRNKGFHHSQAPAGCRQPFHKGINVEDLETGSIGSQLDHQRLALGCCSHGSR